MITHMITQNKFIQSKTFCLSTETNK